MVAGLVLSYSDAPVDCSVSVEWRSKGEKGMLSLTKLEKGVFETIEFSRSYRIQRLPLHLFGKESWSELPLVKISPFWSR